MTKDEIWALIRYHSDGIATEIERCQKSGFPHGSDFALLIVTLSERMIELAHEVYPLEKQAEEKANHA